MVKKQPDTNGSVSSLFIDQHRSSITGILQGFDRLRLRGTLRALYHPKVMESYLQVLHLLWKDFKGFALNLTNRVKTAAIDMARNQDRPYHYLSSAAVRKEAFAREIAQKDGVESGLITVLGCVEPCRTYFMRGNRETKMLELKLQLGKCQHFYFYHIDPVFGFMHLRLQTWFPFQVQVCINGREWLARQMDQHHLGYCRKENCFTSLSNVAGSQRLMDQQLDINWSKELERILKANHPLAREICRPLGLSYFWSVEESEYATDLIFRDAASLGRIYPQLVHHAITSFASPDVLRFLGQRVTAQNTLQKNFVGAVISDLKTRPEGVRVKHGVNGNTIKVYDKQGSVLRVETTINRPRDFRSFRAPEKKPHAKKTWRIMRRGVADLPRRAEVSAAANQRYLHALGSISQTTPLSKCADQLCKPVVRNGQRFRALNPWSEKDRLLFEAISRGEFTINGFRNRDIRHLLFRAKGSEKEQKRRAANITRRLALLRAHGLIKKVTATHRYVLTERGRTTITALLTARRANVDKLTSLSA
jgi:hypothetical protein